MRPGRCPCSARVSFRVGATGGAGAWRWLPGAAEAAAPRVSRGRRPLPCSRPSLRPPSTPSEHKSQCVFRRSWAPDKGQILRRRGRPRVSWPRIAARCCASRRPGWSRPRGVGPAAPRRPLGQVAWFPPRGVAVRPPRWPGTAPRARERRWAKRGRGHCLLSRRGCRWKGLSLNPDAFAPRGCDLGEGSPVGGPVSSFLKLKTATLSWRLRSSSSGAARGGLSPARAVMSARERRPPGRTRSVSAPPRPPVVPEASRKVELG